MHPGERFNSWTHFAGFVLAVTGAVVLIAQSAAHGDAWRITGTSIFAATTIVLYGASTAVHSVRGPARAVLEKLDHTAIYLLIAGTYTPFTLVTLRGPWGWTLFGLVWGLAVLGLVREWRRRRPVLPSVPLYAAMGWSGAIAAVPFWERLPGWGLFWLVAGAVLYTSGTFFYARAARWRHAHGVWHLFVLGGTACHYLCVLLFVG